MKTEKIYYSIHEVSQETHLPFSTLRYWESQFEQLNPRKDGHGNRYYTASDIELIKTIRYIRDVLHITRVDAIRRELERGGEKLNLNQQVADILLKLRGELEDIRQKL